MASALKRLMRSGPSLVLDFLQGVMPAGLTFSRAGPATMVGADGKVQYAPNNLLSVSKWSGPVGPANYPSGWAGCGIDGSNCSMLAYDSAVDAQPLAHRRTAAGGILGAQMNITLPVGVPLSASVYVRIPTGLVAETLQVYTGNGSPSVVTLALATTLSSQPKDAWVRYSADFVMTVAGNVFSLVTSGGAAGVGFDMANPQLSLGYGIRPFFPTTGTPYHGPRLNYDPITQACKGLLIEPQATNFALNSDLKTGVSYTLISGAPVDNGIDSTVIAPDGSVGARKITCSTNGVVRFGDTASGTPSTPYTGSIWVRAADGATTPGQSIDINDSASAGFTSSPGWQRVSGSTPGSAQAYRFMDLNLMPGVYHVWGSQIETGPAPSSYIPTTTAAATRAPDLPTIPTGSWFNASQGTFVAQFDSSDTSKYPRIVAPSSGNNYMSLDPAQKLEAYNGSGAAITVNGYLLGSSARAASAWSPSVGVRVCLSGGSIASQPLPVGGAGASLLLGIYDAVGGTYSYGNGLAGHIAKLTYYPYAAPDAMLQALTK